METNRRKPVPFDLARDFGHAAHVTCRFLAMIDHFKTQASAPNYYN